jgi:hypothetical protein
MIFVAVLIFVSLMGFFIIAFQGVVYGQTTGSLKVYTEPIGVSVYVDGVYSGSIASSLGTTVNGLVAGTYSLKLSLSGYKDWTKQVTITSSQTTTIYAYLESGSGVSVTRSETLSYNTPGFLKVYSQVNGASVYVGGEYGGSIASSLGTTVNGLVAGTYSLKLSLSGYKDWTKQVTITSSQTTTIYAYLENGAGTSVTRNETIAFNSPFGILKVNTGVTGVSVYVDGEYGGSTDSFLEATVNGLIAGTYTLKLRSTSYNELTQQMTIITGQTTTVQPTLTSPISGITFTPSPISGITFTPKPPTPTPTVTPTTIDTNSPTPSGKPSLWTSNSNNIIIVPAIAIIIIGLLGGAFVAVRRKKGDAPNEPRVLHYKTKTVSERTPEFNEELKKESKETNPIDWKDTKLVFISCSSKDYLHANLLYDFLIEHRFQVFFSNKTLPRLGNSDYRRAIDNALEEARHMIIVTSCRNNVNSSWVEAEWGLFINELRSGNKQGNLLTMFVPPMTIKELPASLRNYTAIEFSPNNFETILPYLQ